MRDLSEIGLLLNLEKGARAYQLGSLLSKKQNKTAEEVEIVKSFKHVLRNAVVFTLVCVIIISAAIVFLFSSAEMSSDVKRYGTVIENNKVRYVQNTMQYTSLKDLGIDLEAANEGDQIILFFDHDDQIINAIPEKAADKDSSTKMAVFLIVFVGSVVFLTAATVIMKRTSGKKWYEWLASDEAIRASLCQ